MKFRVKDVPLKLMSSSVLMNPEDVAELGLVVGDRVKVLFKERSCIKDIHIAMEMLDRGEIGFCKTTGPCEITVPEGDEIDVFPVSKPESVEYIKKKMNGGRYSKTELHTIIQDIADNMLNEVELTAFVLSNYLQNVDTDEIEWMTRAMIETGERLHIEHGTVVDKHSIGGVPGNKISLLIVPIIAASGLLIPKTSSRAVTSASGTADTMEVLANVSLTMDEIKEITEQVGGVIAWGGTTTIAPADDLIIQVERHLSIDPKPQLIASILGKKGAIGAKHVVIDIPVGGSKVLDLDHGKELANAFTELGRRIGLEVSCLLTYGKQPIGMAIGPALEAQEALHALEDPSSPRSLIEKSVGIAGTLLEMSGKAINGSEYANDMLKTGKALKKFKEIVEAQGGDPRITSAMIPVGDLTHHVQTTFGGAVSSIDNGRLVRLARAAGAPKDKGAGVLLHKKLGFQVKNDEVLFTIYAEKDWKLDRAIALAASEPPVQVSGMILEQYPQFRTMKEET
ncbi:MAG: AMP phosphorylase [Methanomicrobiales archaeon]|nr:AMP phosphorylase [Methanomicrobiales archaeon]